MYIAHHQALDGTSLDSDDVLDMDLMKEYMPIVKLHWPNIEINEQERRARALARGQSLIGVVPENELNKDMVGKPIEIDSDDEDRARKPCDTRGGGRRAGNGYPTPFNNKPDQPNLPALYVSI